MSCGATPTPKPTRMNKRTGRYCSRFICDSRVAGFCQGEVCRIWMATASEESSNGVPGTIVEIGLGIQVACGKGVLTIEELQFPGGKRLNAKDFLTGHGLKAGQRFE